MEIIPAIDLLGGRCVRLYQGDFGRVTEYDADPLAIVAGYQAPAACTSSTSTGPVAARPATSSCCAAWRRSPA